MFKVLRESLRVGVITPAAAEIGPEVSPYTRGRPEIDWPHWRDARTAARICPTGAIHCSDRDGERTAGLDLGSCIFCGLCAEVDSAIRMTHHCQCDTRTKSELVTRATYRLAADGRQEQIISGPTTPAVAAVTSANAMEPVMALGKRIDEQARKRFGRSLHIRQVDAGSCNGCENEIVNLTGPTYDLERFGMHFVASPRHADMLLVTGPVTRNMELAVRKTYEAMPEPRLVVAVGACGCSGGIFGVNYATRGAVDQVLPVDVYIPGCPPHPRALLDGILLAIDRPAKRRPAA